MKSAEWLEGYTSYEEMYEDDCPYEPGTYEYNEWWDGYEQAIADW